MAAHFSARLGRGELEQLVHILRELGEHADNQTSDAGKAAEHGRERPRRIVPAERVVRFVCALVHVLDVDISCQLPLPTANCRLPTANCQRCQPPTHGGRVRSRVRYRESRTISHTKSRTYRVIWYGFSRIPTHIPACMPLLSRLVHRA
jgi:hypothetical protein